MNNTKERIAFEVSIARWLAKLRESKGVSQEYLATQLGKGQSDIAKMERASKKATLYDVLSWMVALDIPIEKLSEIMDPLYGELHSKLNAWSTE